jgi:hypothetical protein
VSLFWQSLAGLGAVATTALGGWIGTHLHTTAQLHKAQLLTHIADEAAAAVLVNNPNSPIANLSVLVVQQIVAASGHGITDARAIERAAVAALVRQGAKTA